MMALRFAGTCSACGRALAAGSQAAYDRQLRTVTCIGCLPADLDLTTPGSGTAGASAQREHDKRATKRENRIRTAHPKLGGLMLALSDEPASTAAWQKGANGEVVVGAALDRLTPQGVQVLHDRRIPGTKANIDHIAVGPRGVFVIDAKKYQGMVRQQVDGVFWMRTEKLMVGSRNQTKLAGGLRWQLGHVETALEATGFAGIPVFGMLCFVDGNWPILSTRFKIEDIEVTWPKAAAKQVASPGTFGLERMQAIHRALALSFPPA